MRHCCTKGDREVMQNFRLLHTMIRVFDLEKSLEFYLQRLGMSLLRRRDSEEERYSLIFIGYGSENEQTVLELTYNWDQKEPYQLGTGYGHIAIGCSDIHGLCQELEEASVPILRKPRQLRPGGSFIAFIEDPNGYKIELIQKSLML